MQSWTKSKPTEPGYYWFKDKDGIEIAYVERKFNGQLFATLCACSELAYPVSSTLDNSEWAGPLTPPADTELFTDT